MKVNPAIRWIAVGAALLIVALIVTLRGGGDPAPALRPADVPREDPSKVTVRALKFTPDALDFGEILLGQKRTITIAVENTGKKPVTVYRTLFTCTCLSGGMESGVVGPAQSVNLNITFTGLPGKRAYSTFASVITDEPGACKYDLPVQGRIQQDFVAEPETLTFGALKKEGTKLLESVVRRRDGAPFTIDGIKCNRPEFTFSWKPAEEGKKTAYVVAVTAKPLRPGTVAETAIVMVPEFAAASAPALTVSLEAEGDFFCVPAVAVSLVGADGKPGALETVVKARAGGAVKVEGVKETRDLEVQFTQQATEEGGSLLSIRFRNDFPPGAPFGEFLIMVSGQPEPVHLPYRIELPPAKGAGKP